MRAGRFRHFVTLQEKQVTRDVMGGETITWVDRETDVPAEIVPATAKNLQTAHQIYPEMTGAIRIRYYPDITPQWRVRYGARIFSIIGPAVNRDERNVELLLHVTEGVLDV
jgi:SPP1 family predicted phage head-tail adaptor